MSSVCERNSLCNATLAQIGWLSGWAIFVDANGRLKYARTLNTWAPSGNIAIRQFVGPHVKNKTYFEIQCKTTTE